MAATANTYGIPTVIRVDQFTEFGQIATELLALFREDCELKQTYPLLQRWQEILNAMPLESRKSQPWIVCDLPPGFSQSYVVQTTHPTKADDNWRIEWMPFAISPADEREIRDHLSQMLEAWLRVPGLPDTTRHDTKDDTPKKSRKIRPMNTKAADCARRYRADTLETTLKTIVEDYVETHGGSIASIMRILNDNPDQWKRDTDTTS